MQWTRKYSPGAAYSQSKLANLIFALELQRLSDANGWGLMSNAAHPGASVTDLLTNSSDTNPIVKRLKQKIIELIGQSPAAGALPILFAATSPDAKAMGYYGPNGRFELKGAVGPAIASEKAKDVPLARKLWEVSEELTDVHWPTSN